MNPQKGIELIAVMKEEQTYMRLDDVKLDLDEATRVADGMFGVIQHEYEWSWPDKEKHLNTWEHNRGPCIKSSWESEKGFEDRKIRWDAAPEHITNEQAEWLRCALIASRAFEYLYLSRSEGYGLEKSVGFSPKYFYEYVWLCLNQGYGPRVWKAEPPEPPEQEENPVLGSVIMARLLVDEIIRKWEEGVDMDDQVPILTFDDMFPAPADEELVDEIRVRVKRAREPKIEDAKESHHPGSGVRAQARNSSGSLPKGLTRAKGAGVKSRKKGAKSSNRKVSK
ncbi:hypothetical protein F5Y10DRAFT_272530 [Nemania abortiva]|nr:hypothetical protein F5Y10DRAFT_272530 [Nemania abortiva]